MCPCNNVWRTHEEKREHGRGQKCSPYE
jgi:hypothetical protein